MPDREQLPADFPLSEEHRTYVLDVHARLDKLTHYELLGVPRDAPAQNIKRAYFQLVRFIHPDRYFGKELGSYKPKLAAIFTAATKAYQTLTEAGPRAAYDTSLKVERAEHRVPLDPATAARRQAVLDGLKQRSQDTHAKVAQHIATAERARAAGDVAAAVAAYRQALDITPNDFELKMAYDEMTRIVAERKAGAYRRQAVLAERQGRWEQAASCWKQVVAVSPDDAEARSHLADALVRAGK